VANLVGFLEGFRGGEGEDEWGWCPENEGGF
jgi:hypothetical protein